MKGLFGPPQNSWEMLRDLIAVDGEVARTTGSRVGGSGKPFPAVMVAEEASCLV